jgi:hypothetical protein
LYIVATSAEDDGVDGRGVLVSLLDGKAVVEWEPDVNKEQAVRRMSQEGLVAGLVGWIERRDRALE